HGSDHGRGGGDRVRGAAAGGAAGGAVRARRGTGRGLAPLPACREHRGRPHPTSPAGGGGMSWERTLCGASAPTALAAMLAAGSGTGSPARALGCGINYKYSGDQDPAARSGIRARISTIALPAVISGHTAGWVGVGGPGLGPHGADEWVQTGYSAFT